MSLRTTLLENYKAELKAVLSIQKSGVTQLESSWDFTNEYEADSLIPIKDVITELENRISLLSDESCTEEQAEELNY
jgi:hypothetical protein